MGWPRLQAGVLAALSVSCLVFFVSASKSTVAGSVCHEQSQCGGYAEGEKRSDDNNHMLTAGMSMSRSGPGAPTIVSPADGAASDMSTLLRWCTEHREATMQLVYREGGVLFRGWDVATVGEAERVVFDGLQVPQMSEYPAWFLEFNERARRLGVPAAGGITQRRRSRNLPFTKPLTMQCPHVEYFHGPSRPRVAGFYVEVSPAVDGNTALVYFPEAIKRLSPELYALLRDNGWWNPPAGVVQPALLVHPETGLEALQLNTFSSHLAPLALEAYRQVRAQGRPDLPEVRHAEYEGPETFGITLVRPNGTHFDLSRDLELELLRAILSTTTQVSWQKGDIFLFDNVIHGHFRLPGEPPRTIHGIFGDEADTRKFLRDDAPRCVQEAAKAPHKTAVGSTMDNIGPGGNRFVLWLTMQLPDFAFVWAGRHIWAKDLPATDPKAGQRL